MDSEAASTQNHLVQSFRSAVRLGKREVRQTKPYITDAGDSLWLGRKLFAELGWQTRETTIVPGPRQSTHCVVRKATNVVWCQGGKIHRDNGAIPCVNKNRERRECKTSCGYRWLITAHRAFEKGRGSVGSPEALHPRG